VTLRPRVQNVQRPDDERTRTRRGQSRLVRRPDHPPTTRVHLVPRPDRNMATLVRKCPLVCFGTGTSTARQPIGHLYSIIGTDFLELGVLSSMNTCLITTALFRVLHRSSRWCTCVRAQGRDLARRAKLRGAHACQTEPQNAHSSRSSSHVKRRNRAQRHSPDRVRSESAGHLVHE
jgi:hypothetical protein